VQPPTFIDAGAGNLHAAIPRVLVATKRDGSQQLFGGCYITHKVNLQPDVWHLSQAQIAPLDASTSIPTLLGEMSRLIVLAGLLWGTGDLAILLIDVGHDVRAARILLGRQIAHNVLEHPQPPPPSPHDANAHRRTTEITTR